MELSYGTVEWPFVFFVTEISLQRWMFKNPNDSSRNSWIKASPCIAYFSIPFFHFHFSFLTKVLCLSYRQARDSSPLSQSQIPLETKLPPATRHVPIMLTGENLGRTVALPVPLIPLIETIRTKVGASECCPASRPTSAQFRRLFGERWAVHNSLLKITLVHISFVYDKLLVRADFVTMSFLFIKKASPKSCVC